MKRFLHALAALWPERRGPGSPPLPGTRTGILQPGAAVLRMEGILSECADTRICKTAKETVGADAPGELVRSDGGLKLSKRQQSKSANPQIRKSAIKPLLTIVILVFFMCLMAAKQVSAQAEPAAAAAIKPLQIGDTIPEELWHLPLQVVNHPEGKETITLNDYRGKLIILDFWATWCAPCISSLHKLDDLQDQFADNLAVIPTTYEQSEMVAKFFQDRGWNLPTATTERTLKQYFPYQSIPHQVWLKDGKLLAVAGPEYADEEYIGRIIEQEFVDFNSKVEVSFNKSKPLFLNGNGGDGLNMLYQSVISGRLNARVGGSSRPSAGEILAYNRSIEQLYIIALENYISSMYSGSYIHKHILYELDDSLKFRISPTDVLASQDPIKKEQWMTDNWYSYNLVLPTHNHNVDIHEKMFADLNDFFCNYLNIRVSYESRQTDVLALVCKQGNSHLLTLGGPNVQKLSLNNPRQIQLKNEPIESLIHFLNWALHPSERLAINKTGITGNIDLEIDLIHDDVDMLRKKLAVHGLDLIEKSYPVRTIVFQYCDTP